MTAVATHTTLEDGTEIRESDVVEAGALEALNRSEIDIQIATAHRFPRNVRKSIDEATSLATLTPEVAETMIYSLPRAGKNIEGPSVRLAEAVGSSWGNLRYSARIIAIEQSFIVAQGACHDLEKNIAASVEVRRRITDKNGKRYKEDMIVVTGNAACSIALRNAIFKVVPFALARQVYDEAKRVAVGDAASLNDRRAKAIDYFTGKLGIALDRVLAALKRQSIEQVTLDDLATLTGLKTAIKDGDTTVDQAFPDPNEEAESTGKAADLSNRLKDAAKADDAKKQADEAFGGKKPDAAPAPKPAPETPGWLHALTVELSNAQSCEMDEARAGLEAFTQKFYRKAASALSEKEQKSLAASVSNGDVTVKV